MLGFFSLAPLPRTQQEIVKHATRCDLLSMAVLVGAAESTGSIFLHNNNIIAWIFCTLVGAVPLFYYGGMVPVKPVPWCAIGQPKMSWFLVQASCFVHLATSASLALPLWVKPRSDDAIALFIPICMWPSLFIVFERFCWIGCFCAIFSVVGVSMMVLGSKEEFTSTSLWRLLANAGLEVLLSLVVHVRFQYHRTHAVHSSKPAAHLVGCPADGSDMKNVTGGNYMDLQVSSSSNVDRCTVPEDEQKVDDARRSIQNGDDVHVEQEKPSEAADGVDGFWTDDGAALISRESEPIFVSVCPSLGSSSCSRPDFHEELLAFDFFSSSAKNEKLEPVLTTGAASGDSTGTSRTSPPASIPEPMALNPFLSDALIHMTGSFPLHLPGSMHDDEDILPTPVAHRAITDAANACGAGGVLMQSSLDGALNSACSDVASVEGRTRDGGYAECEFEPVIGNVEAEHSHHCMSAVEGRHTTMSDSDELISQASWCESVGSSFFSCSSSNSEITSCEAAAHHQRCGGGGQVLEAEAQSLVRWNGCVLQCNACALPPTSNESINGHWLLCPFRRGAPLWMHGLTIIDDAVLDGAGTWASLDCLQDQCLLAGGVVSLLPNGMLMRMSSRDPTHRDTWMRVSSTLRWLHPSDAVEKRMHDQIILAEAQEVRASSNKGETAKHSYEVSVQTSLPCEIFCTCTIEQHNSFDGVWRRIGISRDTRRRPPAWTKYVRVWNTKIIDADTKTHVGVLEGKVLVVDDILCAFRLSLAKDEKLICMEGDGFELLLQRVVFNAGFTPNQSDDEEDDDVSEVDARRSIASKADLEPEGGSKREGWPLSVE